MVRALSIEEVRRSRQEETDTPAISSKELELLEEIQDRVLWLSAQIIHHANNIRPSVDGLKVGGHQASSASVVSIMTALYFHALRRGDRVSVKPHASPVFHAVEYLLGMLPEEYLTALRAYKGLQSYPSRTKDPDPVDFSTGSVGLGAVAPNFAALGDLYARRHFGDVTSDRFIALVGDAELDEGNVWEALVETSLKPVSNVLWIVDLNRQSLDRVIPGIRAAELKQHFAESGWRVLETKYGSELRRVFARPGGEALRQAIDDMENEEYQLLIRLPGAELREALIQRDATQGDDIRSALDETPDELLPDVISNLGGHDLLDLVDAIEEGLKPSDRPAILFAYTVKGWRLPFYGEALNHSALLNQDQMDGLRDRLGIPPGDEWARFDPDSEAGQLCLDIQERLYGAEDLPPPQIAADQIPDHIGHARLPRTSTQEAFGRLLTQLADIEHVGERIITTSPDVSVSTNLGGWINKVGVFSPEQAKMYLNAPRQQLLRWEPGPEGQHIELGISEMNLFMLLGTLGLSYELSGQLLFPIGTVYDPFICRGLDALIYGVYQESKFIFAGTPAGISLAPEGGAHQSIVTPSIGLEMPGLNYHEPCFAQELEWLLLDAMRECCDRETGKSTYLRLSTKPINQAVFNQAQERFGQEALRRQVLAGGYRLIEAATEAPEADARDAVQLVATGVMVPEAVEAARILHDEGVAANVINLISPQVIFQEWIAWQRWAMGIAGDRPAPGHINTLIPASERGTPIVTVQDGASHSLAWLGGPNRAPIISLGVDDFGQSGDIPSLYRHYEINAEHIATAAFTLLDERDGV